MVNKNKDTNIQFITLSILIDQDGFSFYLHHTNPEQSSLIENIQVEDLLSLKSLKMFKKKLQAISDTYAFKDVKVAYANSYYAFVPKAYYVEDAMADYLKYNVELFEEDQITSDAIESLEIHQVFIPLMNYNNTILEIVEEFEYQHFTNYIIQDIQPKDFDNKHVMHVFIRKSSIDVIAFEGMKFKLCNSFDFETDFDLAYYVLFAVEELKFNQVEMQMNIYHDSESTTWLDVLKEYVKHVSCERKDLAAIIS